MFLVLHISDHLTGNASQKCTSIPNLDCVPSSISICLLSKDNCLLTCSCYKRFVINSANEFFSKWKGFPKQGYWKTQLCHWNFLVPLRNPSLFSLTTSHKYVTQPHELHNLCEFSVGDNVYVCKINNYYVLLSRVIVNILSA